MRLLNVNTGRLEEFLEFIPPYAILSHTWGQDHDEVSFQDMQKAQVSKQSTGKSKLDGLCKQAKADNHNYVWVDTCCIDKSNSTELSEAINSMFKWYQNASVCYAFLSDVSSTEGIDFEKQFRGSKWFTRGWTLQELLAPRKMDFYNQNWCLLGHKQHLAREIATITGIPRRFILGFTDLHKASVAQRMSWAATRVTKRKEDVAYSLLGIFNVNIPMIYGEGIQAFVRLQEEIIRKIKDDSVLAWGFNANPLEEAIEGVSSNLFGNVLAFSPADFANSGMVTPFENSRPTIEGIGGSGGFLHVRIPLHTTKAGQTLGLLSCRSLAHGGAAVGIPLCSIPPGEESDEYIRPAESKALLVSAADGSSTATESVRIYELLRAEDAPSHHRRFGFHIDLQPGTGLRMGEIFSFGKWTRDDDVLSITMDLRKDDSQQLWIRFHQHSEKLHRDFVVVLDLEIKKTRALARCYVMVAASSTTLSAIAHALAGAQDMLQEQAANNGYLTLEVKVEEESMGSQLYVVFFSSRMEPNETTIDAGTEMDILNRTITIRNMFSRDHFTVITMLKLMEELAEKEAGLLVSGRGDVDEMQNAMHRPKGTSWVENKSNIDHIRRKINGFVEETEAAHSQMLKEIQQVVARSSGEKRLLHWHASMLNYLSGYLRGSDEPANASTTGLLPWTFMRSVYLGNNAVMKYLYKYWVPHRDIEDADGRGVLSTAIAGGNSSALDWLIQNGFDPNQSDSLGLSPLAQAASKGDCAATKVLLKHNVNMETEDNGGNTPLVLAVLSNWPLVLRMLLSQGADLTGGSPVMPPLALAAHMGYFEVLNTLLDYGASVDIKSQHGRTPLSLAVINGHQSIIHRLLLLGAAIDARDVWGHTPLALACQEGHFRTAQLLVDSAADLESRDDGDCTPLGLAAQKGHLKVVELLLAKGANIEVRDAKGRTPLMLAMEAGHEKVVKALLDQGAQGGLKVVAMFPFVAQKPGDLSMRANDVITVLKKTGDVDWWTGMNGNECGVFPSNYVETARY